MPKPTFFNLPEEKRRRLIELAIEEFANNDYDQASISRMVSRAGIAKGSLYQYFEDKRDLYQYLLDLAAREKHEFLHRQTPPDPGMGIFPFMHWMLQQGTSFELANPLLARLAYRALYGGSPLPEETLAQGRSAAGRYFEELIRQGAARGEVNPETDIETAAFIFKAVFTSLGSFLLERAGLDPEEFARSGDPYPVASDEVRRVYDQVMAILQFGVAGRER